MTDFHNEYARRLTPAGGENPPENSGIEFPAHPCPETPPEIPCIGPVPVQETGIIGRLKSRKGLSAVLGSGLLVLVKFKTLLFFLLTKLKFLVIVLKLGKFAGTFVSMTLMIWVYAQLFGWMFGVGFVLLLLVHETGHYLTARQLGLNVSLPVFIPFFGAFIALKDRPRDAVVEAKVALGGPFLGSLAAALCVPLYLLTGSQLFLALAYTGFFLNLFNLIPLYPLDGGRAVSAISPWLWLLGIPVGFYFFLQSFNPIILGMLVLGILQVVGQWKKKDRAYYEVSAPTRAVVAGAYFGLMGLLGIGMTCIHDIHADMFMNK